VKAGEILITLPLIIKSGIHSTKYMESGRLDEVSETPRAVQGMCPEKNQLIPLSENHHAKSYITIHSCDYFLFARLWAKPIHR
jgi:hypothetical protein